MKDIFLFATMPFRIFGFLVKETGDSFAVMVGWRWRGPDGKTHWRARKGKRT